MAKQGFGPALISVTVISVVVVAAVSASLYHTRLIGPVIVLLGVGIVLTVVWTIFCIPI